MSENQISNFFTTILIILGVIFFILLVALAILTIKERNRKSEKIQKKNINNDSENVKKDIEYSKNSIFKFMEFDKIEDNMIIRKNGIQYLMAIECQGINYDLMSSLEKNSVEEGFLQFLNTLRYPIQLYIQTRTVNLGNSIQRYRERVNNIKNEYIKKQMEYNSILVSDRATMRDINNARFELVKIQNLYEYGLDIIENTERMNLNKNILKKHYYVIISYTPEEVSDSKYDKEEIKSMAFSDLYTRAQALISSLGVCDVYGKVLDSKELAELLYIAYNRDEAEVYQLDKALKAGTDELYSTAKDVLDKRMKLIDLEIERKANIRANEVVAEAFLNKEKERKVKEKEAKMKKLIDAMAESMLAENEEIIGTDVKEEAEKILRKKSE